MQRSTLPDSVSPPIMERSWSIAVFAYLLFFASGASALIYEIVWTRMLTAQFGASIYAVSAVLTGFMAGLALGAALIGRFSDRIERPLLAYAVLELCIGAAGIVMPLVLSSIGFFDGWIYSQGSGNFALLTAVRFAVAIFLLLGPAALMGGTLPVMSRAIVRRQTHLGKHVGGLYAINTLGAVAGAFLAGFWLIGHLGMFATEMTAASLNFLAGLGALLLVSDSRQRAHSTASGAAAQPAAAENAARQFGESAPRAVAFVLIAAFVSGGVALAAQVLWSRSLIFTFGELKNTTYCFSAMLSVFLAGLGLGSAIAGRFADRLSSPLFAYGVLLCLIAISIASSAVLLQWELPSLQAVDADTDSLRLAPAAANVIFKTVLVIGAPTLLMGLAFPIAVKAVSSMSRLGSRVGALYALNTTGAVAGALLAPFVVAPLFGLTGGIIALAVLEALVGMALLTRADVGWPWRAGMACLTAAALLPAWMWLPERGALQTLREGESLIYYEESPVATVAVIEDPSGQRRICVDDVAVAGTTSIMQTDQKSLAHVATLLVDDPRAALTVGFGSGGASYSFLLHDRLERVDCVEICPAVVRCAPHLQQANHGFLQQNDPRYHLIYDDAAAYLRYAPQQYDIISSDCTDLKYKSSGGLYDLEYFRHCRDKLRPGGILVAWMPLGGVSEETFRTALRTFYRVFPETAVFYMHNEWTHYVLLLGWRDTITIDFDQLAQRMQEPDVKADLAEIGIGDPYKFLAAFVTSGRDLDQYLQGETLNTRNHPVIEFQAPKQGHLHRTAQVNLLALMQHRVSVRPWVVGSSVDWERLQRHEQAAPFILQGQFHARRMDVESATLAYLQALQITPEDQQVRAALQFPWLVRLAEMGNPTAWLLLGRSHQLQGNTSHALELFEKYLQQLAEIDAGIRAASPDMVTQARAWRETAQLWREEGLRTLSQQ